MSSVPGSGTPGSNVPGAVGGSSSGAVPSEQNAPSTPTPPSSSSPAVERPAGTPKGTQAPGQQSFLTSDQKAAQAQQQEAKDLGFYPGGNGAPVGAGPGGTVNSVSKALEKASTDLGIIYESQTPNLVNGVISTGGMSARDIYVGTLLGEAESGYKGQGFKTETDYLQNRLSQVGLALDSYGKITDPLEAGIIEQQRENLTKGGYAGIAGPSTSISEKLGSSFGQKGLGYVQAVNPDGTLNYGPSQIASLINSVKSNPEYGGNQNFLVGNIGTENSTGSTKALNIEQARNTDIANALQSKNKSISLTESLSLTEGIGGGKNIEAQGSEALGNGLASLSYEQQVEKLQSIGLENGLIDLSNKQIEDKNLKIEQENQIITQENNNAKVNFAVDYLLPNKEQSRFTGSAAIFPPAIVLGAKGVVAFIKNTGLGLEATAFSLAERLSKANIFSSNPLGITEPFNILTPKNEETLQKYQAPGVDVISATKDLLTGKGTGGFSSGQGSAYDISYLASEGATLLIGSGITQVPKLLKSVMAVQAVKGALETSSPLPIKGTLPGYEKAGEITLERASSARTMPTYKNLNPMRNQLPTDIFKLDNLATPVGSASVKIPQNNTLENTPKEIAGLGKIQSDLLKPVETSTGLNVPVQEDIFYSNTVPMKSLGATKSTSNNVAAVDTGALLGTGETPPEDLTGGTGAPIKKPIVTPSISTPASELNQVPGVTLSGLPGGTTGGVGVPDVFQTPRASRIDFERSMAQKENSDLFESNFVPKSNDIISPQLRSTEIGQRLEAFDLFKKGLKVKQNPTYYSREGIPIELMGKFSKLISSQTTGVRPEIFGTKEIKPTLEDLEYNPAENFQSMPRQGVSPFDIRFGETPLYSNKEFTSDLLSPEEQAAIERYPLMKNTLPIKLNPFEEPRSIPLTGKAPIQKETFDVTEVFKGREEAKFFGTFENPTSFEKIGYVPKSFKTVAEQERQLDPFYKNTVPLKRLESNNGIGTNKTKVDVEDLIGKSINPKEEFTEVGLSSLIKNQVGKLQINENEAFHGTDLKSALNIQEKGAKITLEKGKGFHVTQDPFLALAFADLRQGLNKSAVLLKYNISSEKLSKIVGGRRFLKAEQVPQILKEKFSAVEGSDIIQHPFTGQPMKEILVTKNDFLKGTPKIIDVTDILEIIKIKPKAEGLSPLREFPNYNAEFGTSTVRGEIIETREEIPVYKKNLKTSETAEDVFYSPQQNIRQFFERLESNNGIGKNKTRINTNQVLGIDNEEPSIGESNDRLKDIETGGLKREQREKSLAKTLQMNEEDVLTNARQFFENQRNMFSETKISLGTGQGRFIPKGGGTGSTFKSFTKPSNPKPEEPKPNERTLEQGGLITVLKTELEEKPEQRFKEYPISLGRSKPKRINTAQVARTIKTQKPENKYQVIITPLQEQKKKQKLNTVPILDVRFKESQDQTFKQGQSQKQSFKLIALLEETPAQEQLFQPLQAQKQKQPLKTFQELQQIPENPFPQEPPQKQFQTNIPFIPQIPKSPPKQPPKIPPFMTTSEPKRPEKHKKKKADRANFLGNSSEFQVTGIYNRNEIIYGVPKINKLVSRDTTRAISGYKEKRNKGLGKNPFKGRKYKL